MVTIIEVGLSHLSLSFSFSPSLITLQSKKWFVKTLRVYQCSPTSFPPSLQARVFNYWYITWRTWSTYFNDEQHVTTLAPLFDWWYFDRLLLPWKLGHNNLKCICTYNTDTSLTYGTKFYWGKLKGIKMLLRKCTTYIHPHTYTHTYCVYISSIFYPAKST